MTAFTIFSSTSRLRASLLSMMLAAFALAFTATNIHARNFCGGCSGDDKATPTPTPTASPSPGATPTPQPTPRVNAHIETTLAGASLNGATPTGEAEFERESEGSRKLTVKVEHVNLPDGTRLNVFIDGVKVGEIVLAGGRGELSLSTSHGQTTPPVVNGTTISVANQSGTTIVSGAFTASLPKPGATPTPTPTPATGGDVRVRVPLSGAPLGGRLPEGHADFRTRADGRRSLEVEVEEVNLPAGTTLNVLVNNVQVGQITLGALLRGELEFESEHGQTVPAVAQGTTVAVVNAATGATILAGTFGAIANTPNPLEDDNFFVRQQYVDFLVRAPEQEGLEFYLNILTGCGATDDPCIRYTRGALSANFFRSPEFQQRGSFVMYLYMVTLGQRPATVAELGDDRKIDRPHYTEFMADLQAISGADDQGTNARKDGLAVAWLQRAEIQQRYGSLTNAQFVQKLIDTAGVTLSNQAQLVAALNAGTMMRAQVLRAVVESAEVDDKFRKQAFVTMEYFGYLHRDPESCAGSPDPSQCGYIFHNNRFKLSSDPDFLENTIVRGFIESPEYRSRFGPN